MLHDLSFWIVAMVTLVAAAGAMCLRNLVHCALCGALAFAGVALSYLLLDAEFAALAQYLVYVGAIAVLLVFGIMLTRGAEIIGSGPVAAKHPFFGLIVAGAFGGVLIAALGREFSGRAAPPAPAISTRLIGEHLMGQYVVSLETLGLLLTAALIGAVVIAFREMPARRPRAALTRQTPPCENLEPAAKP